MGDRNLAERVGAGAGSLETRVVTLGQALRRIELRGPLPVGWAGRFASGLAARQISIIRGWACERAVACWEAQLEVAVPELGAALDPAALAGLTAQDAPPSRSALEGLQLLGHHLERTRSEVVVRIEGHDARGFLDRVLRLFALYGLFPRELQLETEQGVARDAFHLRSLHGSAPEHATTSALSSRLRRITAGTSG